MGFHVSEEQLDAVHDEAIEVLAANRNRPLPTGHFNWLYRDNPDGPAVVWVVRPDDSRELAGFTVALPRRMHVDGHLKMCWNCADFTIQLKYRSLGMAIALRRAATEGVNQGQVDFLYAHPNERMQVIHERVKHTPVGNMVRSAMVLRSRHYLEERLPTNILPAVSAALIDPAVRWSRSTRRLRSGFDITHHKIATFDQRFDELFRKAAPQIGVIGVRDAAYLKWRFGANPIYPVEILLAEKDSELAGYLVFRVESGVVHVMDVLALDQPHIVDDLLLQLVRHCYGRGIVSISAVYLDGNPLESTLERVGFSRRPETSTMFAHVHKDNPIRQTILEQSNWYLTVGDRDV